MQLFTRNRYATSMVGGLIAAATATVAILGSIVLLFDSAGSTPWVTESDAARVEHCAQRRSSSERHACLQATLRDNNKTAVAAR